MEANQEKTKIITHSKKRLAAIVAAIIIIATFAVLTSSLLMTDQNTSSPQNNDVSSQTNNQNNPQSWIQIGAYATYQGQTSILSIPVSFTAKMEIVDLNDTYIQVLTDFNMSTPYGATENTTTTWVSRENMTFQPDGLTLNSTYSTQVTLPNLGTHNCTVYEYNSQGISAAYYVDNSIQWPIEMVMTSPASVDGQLYSMDIILVDTNIPGL